MISITAQRLFSFMTALLVMFVAFVIAQICAAFLGFAYFTGGFFAFCALTLCIVFGLVPVIGLAAFFGALHGWHWHWFFALLFSLPVIVLALPLLRTAVLSALNIKTFSFARAQRERMTVKSTIDGRVVEAEILEKNDPS